MREMVHPLSRLRRLPPLQGDDTLAAGRPLLGVPRLGRASFVDCEWCVELCTHAMELL